ncbi:exo-beta-N-acetylmuramidase NamZ family protein [Natronorubrum sp. DTA28]|uniref:exo-beta-N-acetylmuramidase NamZ family protein n=1 Tax=Natronorubrum sp. DTA28 TaxID=3447019 RepID=UPI003F82D0D8
MVRVGIETLVETDLEAVEGDRIGLITNPSGVDSALVPTIDTLYNHDSVELVRLFGPEHGIRGNEQAGVKVADSVDERTGIPVTSLYGDNRRLDPDMVADLDTVIYDMQDIGCRFYTLIYTLAYALAGVSETDTSFVVLDRPNPIAPLGIDGNRVPTEHESFVGGRRLPITHGLTVGELARYFNGEFGLEADLEVVELDGWTRDTWYDEIEHAWVPPSPNMPTLDTATIYPGTCLFEGTTLSEGRGTTKPFELLGATWVDAEEWAATLNDLEIAGGAFRPAYFTPMFSKHERQDVEGVQVHVMDRNEISPVEIGMKMLITAFQLYPETDWVESNGDYFIDKLGGGPSLRETITDVDPAENADDVYDRLDRQWAEDRAAFADVTDEYVLYQ